MRYANRVQAKYLYILSVFYTIDNNLHTFWIFSNLITNPSPQSCEFWYIISVTFCSFIFLCFDILKFNYRTAAYNRFCASGADTSRLNRCTYPGMEPWRSTTVQIIPTCTKPQRYPLLFSYVSITVLTAFCVVK